MYPLSRLLQQRSLSLRLRRQLFFPLPHEGASRCVVEQPRPLRLVVEGFLGEPDTRPHLFFYKEEHDFVRGGHDKTRRGKRSSVAGWTIAKMVDGRGGGTCT